MASRAVTPWWNAAAISGEYLSAASFLGVAGLMLKFGASALWLPIGFTAGYLTLLLFVAAPLRRFGSYTIPDFAEARLPAPYMRLLAAGIVLLISGCYLVPQLKGAGVTLRAVTGAPYWVGVALVAAIVALNVGLGGMRGVTYVQAFQYWVKVFAIALPGDPAADPPRRPARARRAVRQRAPADRADGMTVDARRAGDAHVPGHGRDPNRPAGELRCRRTRPSRSPRASTPRPATSGRARSRVRPWLAAADLHLLLATFLGTMGLPHILVRFYTNPDGSAARRTTVRVLGLLGAFYLFPPSTACSAARSRPSSTSPATPTPSCCASPPPLARRGGDILAAIVAAGASPPSCRPRPACWSIAGTVSHDVLPGKRRRGARAVPGGGRRSGWSPRRCWRSPPARSTSPARRLGVRAGGEHVLPAAAARRLVAAADRPRGGARMIAGAPWPRG